MRSLTRSGPSDRFSARWLATSAAAELGLDSDHGLAWTSLPSQEVDLYKFLGANMRLAALVRRRLADAYADSIAVTRRVETTVRAVADALLESGASDAEDVRRIAAAGVDWHARRGGEAHYSPDLLMPVGKPRV